jgi:signal transduction histidine kinase/ActR/RegA family two-component response regulator
LEKKTPEPSPASSEEARLHALLAALEAAAQGDFTRLPVQGTSSLADRLAQAFNALADRASAVTTEVVRVTMEVGTEGRLGGQAQPQGASGTWKELIGHVNRLAEVHSAQLRDLARVAVAVARGDLSQKITVEARGEVLELKLTVNTMVDQLSAFAAEVNRVAKEVGTEGKRGHQPVSQGMMGVWKDLSDNVNVTEQLALASRYKSEFLANMSHELRTPLNSLLILAKALSENNESHLSMREVEYAKTIHSSGTDLLSLINELLDLSKVEAGKMRVEPTEVPLTELKQFVERTFRHVAEQKGLGFSITLDAGLPPSLRTDPQRLQQILKNLLANAFKFTGSGRVELRIFTVDSRQRSFESEGLRRAGAVLGFSVVDSGIGIPQDKQKLIFEAFQQAEGSTSREYGGTGLGLSISLAMTRLLGGELLVESQPGKGSTFTLYLPRQYAGLDSSSSVTTSEAPSPTSAPSLIAPPPSTPAERDARLAGRKVLLVDDDIRNIFALTSVLESRGLQVLHAENGKVGIEVLRAHPDVDAVVMDMMMPEQDGYETMRAIRRDSRFATLPIIALTAQALKEDRDKCLAAGASDYLPKPADTDRLLELLRRWCRQAGPYP